VDGDCTARATWTMERHWDSSTSSECASIPSRSPVSVLYKAADPMPGAAAPWQRSISNIIRDDENLRLAVHAPFDRMAHDPGYIKATLRASGRMAAVHPCGGLVGDGTSRRLGDVTRRLQIFSILIPINHTSHARAMCSATRSNPTLLQPTCIPLPRTWVGADGLVHRFRRLALPVGNRGDPRLPAAGRFAVRRSMHTRHGLSSQSPSATAARATTFWWRIRTA